MHINTVLNVSNTSMWHHIERSNVWLRIIVKTKVKFQMKLECLNLVGKRNTDILIRSVCTLTFLESDFPLFFSLVWFQLFLERNVSL